MFFETTCWDAVKAKVKAVNKDFYKLIEENIAPTSKSKYPLYLARYAYGKMITIKGAIQFPGQMGKQRIPKAIIQNLAYSTTPLILQLNRQAEAFIDSNERTVPLNVFSPGDFYGLFEAVELFTGSKTDPLWDISSGVRTSFMLPRVSDSVFHKRLQKYYQFSQPAPTTFYSQWEIFKQIAKHHEDSEPWSTEILIFPKQWFAEHKGHPGWLAFQNYLLRACWRQAELFRKKHALSACWDTFAPIIRSLKPTIYLLDTVKHLMQAAGSVVPGFKPTLQNDEGLPSCLIERAYTDIYRLKDYAPCVMIPEKLTDEQVFYSMAYPTLLEGTPSMRRMRSFLTEVRSVQKLLTRIVCTLRDENNLQGLQLLEKNFNFYHTGTENDPEIQHASVLERAPYLSALKDSYYPGLNFPTNSHFFRGCIGIDRHKC